MEDKTPNEELQRRIAELEAKVAALKQAEEDAQQLQKRLEAVKKAGASANATLDLKEVLQRILYSTLDAAGASVGMIFLRDSETGCLSWGASVGLSDGFVSSFQNRLIQPNEGLTGRVAESGESIFIPTDSSRDSRVARPVVMAEGLNSFIGVPVYAADEIVGVMNILTRPPVVLSEPDITMAAAIGAHVGSAIRNAQLFDQLTRADVILRTEQDFLETLINSLNDTFFVYEIQTGKALRWNRVFKEISGYSDDEIAVMKVPDDYYDKTDLPRVSKAMQTLLREGNASMEMDLITKDGNKIPFEYVAALVESPVNGQQCVIAIGRDIRERRKMEAELLSVHKLESIGLLAGGIAHDFNNILTGVMGNVTLAKLYARPGGEIHERLHDAEQACIRSLNLTQQLLTFSKGGEPLKKNIALSKIIQETAGFALLGSNVRCEYLMPEELWLVEADEGQLGQVIQNLVINADQAMPDGGKLTVGAENIVIRENETMPLQAGRYVKLTVSDQGVGIMEDHIAKIFDPYFSTKQKGSGLGLSVVYSIVRNHGGHITIDSEAGAGTTFHTYLPAAINDSSTSSIASQEIMAGKGRVLVMDDEENVRRIAAAMLGKIGYEVNLAVNGIEAIELYKSAMVGGEPFAAVILDLTIAGGLGGKETISELLAIDPEVKALVSSGYANDPVMANFRDHGFSEIISKPYSIAKLSQTLHALLH